VISSIIPSCTIRINFLTLKMLQGKEGQREAQEAHCMQMRASASKERAFSSEEPILPCPRLQDSKLSQL
jgi:hypothetical protein